MQIILHKQQRRYGIKQRGQKMRTRNRLQKLAIQSEFLFNNRVSLRKQVEKTPKEEKNKRSEKKVFKEVVASLGSVEDNLLKTINKEITAQFMVIQEKQEEMNLQFAGIEEQIQMFSHKHAPTREECDERINSIANLVKENNEFLRANMTSQGLHNTDMDADLMKIFQHIKTLLQTDYKVAEMESQIGNLKSQLSQLRNAVNEIGDFVSKI